MYAAPDVASEIRTGADQVAPPLVEFRYQAFQASTLPPPDVSIQAIRTSPDPRDSIIGSVASSPTVETTVAADHVVPWSFDVFAEIVCLPPAVVAPSYR